MSSVNRSSGFQFDQNKVKKFNKGLKDYQAKQVGHFKKLAGHMATGALLGAGYGAMGFNPLTIGGGALLGAAAGFVTGTIHIFTAADEVNSKLSAKGYKGSR